MNLGHPVRGPGRESGRALVGLLAALAVFSLILASIVGLGGAVAVRSTHAAAQRMAGEMRAMGLEALGDGRSRAILFPLETNEPYASVCDGDGDGVRRGDLRDATDHRERQASLALDFPGIRIAPPPWPVPDLPPRRGSLGPETPAIRFGSARQLSFTAEGHATSGSLFITDGRDALCAIVVSGSSARVRVLCYLRSSGLWEER